MKTFANLNNSKSILSDLVFGPQNRPYIGDFPPDYPMYPPFPPDPFQPGNIPISQKLFPIGPSIIPNVNDHIWTTSPAWTSGIISITSNVGPNAWRITPANDRITASVDMPAVRPADLTVELENGTIKVAGKRFDTGLHVSHQQFIGTDYDPKTADATLEAGVLTVVVMRFKEKVAHKVPVTVK